MIVRSKNAPEIYTREKCFITELLNSAEVGSLSLARARVESGVTTELHRLNVDEVYYILEGEGSMQIDNQPAKDV
ncbi:MAG: cupin domain-containing protein, partial [Saprospiraceae bacterium]|nr:cupin domain-containing protein [Saprospiraceae bacterium]